MMLAFGGRQFVLAVRQSPVGGPRWRGDRARSVLIPVVGDGQVVRLMPAGCSYNGRVPRRRNRRLGPGRPPLPELTLTAPKTAPFTRQQRAGFVSLLADMIVNWRQEQHCERPRAAAPRKNAHRPEEPPGHSLAP